MAEEYGWKASRPCRNLSVVVYGYILYKYFILGGVGAQSSSYSIASTFSLLCTSRTDNTTTNPISNAKLRIDANKNQTNALSNTQLCTDSNSTATNPIPNAKLRIDANES
jgi:hypothetical protein